MAGTPARRRWEPPRLYSWTVIAPGAGSTPPEVGAVGVADDHGRALLHAGDALREAPAGSRCLVHRVMLSFSRIGYFYEALVARGRLRRGSSGTVVWEALPAPGVQLAPLITDARETIGDSLPPEAIAAGLADLELHQERLRRPGRAPAER